MTYCAICRKPGHPSAAGHRFSVPCEWPLGCTATAHRAVDGINYLGDRVIHWYCEDHLRDIISGDALRRTLELADRMGLTDQIGRPDIQAADKVLRAHQEVCTACAGVRDWILKEMGAGRIQNAHDRDRVGLYTMEHACREGLVLFADVGRVMRMNGG